MYWNRSIKKRIFLSTLLTSTILLAGCNQLTADESNIVTYKGVQYAPLEYPAHEIYYDYNGHGTDAFDEVDGIYPIESPQWKMIWNGGDLYCIKKSSDEANLYYATDTNYDWYVQIDRDDEETSNMHRIKVTDSELDVIYTLDEIKKDTAVFFDEFESLGSLIKISKDGMVRGTLSIAKYSGQWYWKSEIIDENREHDGTWPEYIQPLPGSLNEKIEKSNLKQ